MIELSTTTEVFEALGGIAEVARLTRRKYNAASNWHVAGSFPSNTLMALTEALKERGYTAPASLWRMREPERAAS